MKMNYEMLVSACQKAVDALWDDEYACATPFLFVMPNGNVYGSAGPSKYSEEFHPAFIYDLLDAAQSIGLFDGYELNRRFWDWASDHGFDIAHALAREVRDEIWEHAEEHFREYPEEAALIADLECI